MALDTFIADRTQGHNEWYTPPSIWRPLDDAVGGFDLDPCSGCEPTPIADTRYTEDDDGLTKPWFGRVWVNPPYDEKEDWIKKSIAETTDGRADTVLTLIPSRTAPQWWHRNIPNATAITFLEGYIEFGGAGNATFGSVIAVFGTIPDGLLDTLGTLGIVYTHPDSGPNTRHHTHTQTTF